MRKLELETEVKLRQLALQNAAEQTSSEVTPGMSPPLGFAGYDVRRHVALPSFRETEVDSYFSTFECLAAALKWPKEIWTTLLQCKLIGKAQDVMATLTLEESMDYDIVKAAILRVYELVLEAYRQKF